MQYKINTANHRDFDTFERNKRAGRAYFIPYTDKKKLAETPLARERFGSPLVTLLSGEWDFKYYEKEADMPVDLDTAAVDFDKIQVPCTWQRTGYDGAAYINVPYPFDNTPPELPQEMPTSVYRKLFTLDALCDTYYLDFLGVIPCVNLYINGKFVGYSEGAHNTAEFDITSFVQKGENELVVVLPKWSTATFLECQDMFRENGIFRDVLLYGLPKTNIEDYALHTRKDATGWHLDAAVTLTGDTDGYSICLEFDNNGEWVSEEIPAAAAVKFSLNSLKVDEWNAEMPTLYELYLTLKKDGKTVQVLRNMTGFKQIEIRGNVFYFNDKPIKLKGVNHHDTNYLKGYAMDWADYEQDVKLVKSLNGNCIRTSHYPPDAQLLTLADVYGLYIVDEADIETHGCGVEPHRNPQLISHNLAWAPRYVDRILRMVYRDRNHACVTMWSMGNEAEGWACQDEAYNEIKRVCPQIPVHYEGVIRTPRHSYDVISEMYTNHENLIAIREGTRPNPQYIGKPFYMCEYAHAMGVGPGAMEEYWQIIYSDDVYMGGCIWEWADHAMYHENGPLKFTYGGDHGEWRHDGNFCVDGLVYPDRRLHTGAREMQAVYRPVRARQTEDGSFVFTNTNRFRNASYLTVEWSLLKDGIETESGSFPLDIAPQGEQRVTLDLSFPKRCECYVNFTYQDENGAFVAKEQVLLQEFAIRQPRPRGKELTLNYDGKILAVNFTGGAICFNSKTGDVSSYKLGEKELINQTPADRAGFTPNIFRPFIDNDRGRQMQWTEAGHDKYEVVLKEFEFELDADEDAPEVEVELLYDLVVGKKVIARVEMEYTVYPGGAMDVESKIKFKHKKEMAADILRFGAVLELPRSFENVEYYGLGEYENLPDFSAQSTVGYYKTTVSDMHEPYIKPQESGYRTKVRWVKLSDAQGSGLMFCNADKPFAFNTRHFSQRLLQNAKHQEDLKDENTTVINIDGFVRGAGSASCGPDVLEQYMVDASRGLEFKFTAIPMK